MSVEGEAFGGDDNFAAFEEEGYISEGGSVGFGDLLGLLKGNTSTNANSTSSQTVRMCSRADQGMLNHEAQADQNKGQLYISQAKLLRCVDYGNDYGSREGSEGALTCTEGSETSAGSESSTPPLSLKFSDGICYEDGNAGLVDDDDFGEDSCDLMKQVAAGMMADADIASFKHETAAAAARVGNVVGATANAGGHKPNTPYDFGVFDDKGGITCLARNGDECSSVEEEEEGSEDSRTLFHKNQRGNRHNNAGNNAGDANISDIAHDDKLKFKKNAKKILGKEGTRKRKEYANKGVEVTKNKVVKSKSKSGGPKSPKVS